jgi:hypothetical protein
LGCWAFQFGIQVIPGGKGNILRGHSIGYSKSRSDEVDEEILRTVSNTGIYCSNDKAGTVYLV